MLSATDLGGCYAPIYQGNPEGHLPGWFPRVLGVPSPFFPGILLENLRKASENGSGFGKEGWLKRMDKDSFSRMPPFTNPEGHIPGWFPMGPFGSSTRSPSSALLSPFLGRVLLLK